MNSRCRIISVCSLIFCALLGLSLPIGSSAQSVTPMVISFSNLTPNQVAPLWIADERGFFKKYGLDPKMVLIEGGSRSAQAFAAGEVAMGVLAAPTMINAAAGGLDLVMLLSLMDELDYGLVTVQSVTRVEDLRGKTIGINRFGSAADIIVRLVLEHFGLDLERDKITILQVGGDSARAAAMAKGAVQATVFNLAVAKRLAETEKLNFLQDLSTLDIPYQHTGLVTTRTYLKTHPEMVEKGMRAVLEGMAFAVRPENKSEVMKTIATRLRLDQVEKAAEDYTGLLRIYKRYPVPNTRGITALIKFIAQRNPKAARLTAEDLVDTLLLQKLQGEGFLAKLYR